MKEPEYNIILMLTYSGLTVQDGQKEENIIFNAEAIKSKYPTIVADNYRYRGVVEITMYGDIMV